MLGILRITALFGIVAGVITLTYYSSKTDSRPICENTEGGREASLDTGSESPSLMQLYEGAETVGPVDQILEDSVLQESPQLEEVCWPSYSDTSDAS